MKKVCWMGGGDAAELIYSGGSLRVQAAGTEVSDEVAAELTKNYPAVVQQKPQRPGKSVAVADAGSGD